eukprot:13679327-Alexandrium_andersonii.AAC.1
MRKEQLAAGSSMSGKSTATLVSSLVPGLASPSAAGDSKQGRAPEGHPADRSSPAKGDVQQGDAEPAGPVRPGDDEGTGKVDRNKKRNEQRKRQGARDKELQAEELEAEAAAA